MATPLMSLPDQSQGKRKYVVPWKSRKEFLQIYHDIYSEDEELRLKAIKRITTWKSRAGSKLSVAVENTGRLFESVHNHRIALREHCVHEKEDGLRASYGVSIIRFVNFVTERGQNKAVAQPVHVVARQFGIPEWIVRIRHDTTHNIFPSLDMLSTAACWAIQYLKEEFWQHQTHDYNPPGSKRHQSKNKKSISEIRQTIQTFKKLRFEEISSDEQKKTVSELKALRQFVNENRFSFMSCLLESGNLIPLSNELEKFGLHQEDILNQPSPCLPTQLSEFWHPLMIMLNNVQAVGTLVKVAMFSLTDTDCLRNHLIAGWLDFILKGTKPSPDRSSKDGLTFHKSSLPMKDLLDTCLDHTNKFSFHLIKYLLDREELGEEAYMKLSDLVKVTAALHESGDEEEKSAYSVQDVKEASFSHDVDANPSPLGPSNVQSSISDDSIGWKICTDLIDWSSVPLGMIPSQEEEVEENSGEGSGNEDEVDDGDEVVDNDPEEYDDDDDDDERRTRDWKQLRRKRSYTDDDNEERTSPKRSTYTVNNTELL